MDFAWLSRVQKEQGAPLRVLKKLPSIPSGIAWAWEAYGLLSARRTYTNAGPQPIQISEMVALAEVLGLDDSDRLDMMRYVTALDDLYVDHMRRNPPTPADNKPTKNTSKTGNKKTVRVPLTA